MAKVYCVLVFFCLCLHISQCQFDFFPNRRDDRRYETPFGFQNYLPHTSRIRHRLTGHLHMRPERPDSNPDYVYPFNNRPGGSNGYDRFGRPYQNYQSNYPNNADQYGSNQYNYPNAGNQPYYDMPVRFPSSYPEEPNNYQNPPIIVPNYNGQDQPSLVQALPNEAIEPKNDSNGETGVEDYSNGIPIIPPNPENPTLPSLTQSDPKPEFLPFNPVPPSELSQLNPIPESESKMELPPFSQFPGSGFPQFSEPIPDSKELLPLTPVPPSESNTDYSPFNPGFPQIPIPTSESKELPPLTPVPPSEPEKSPFNPGYPQIPIPTSESKELPPLTPVPPSEPEKSPFNPGFPQIPIPTSESKELPPLTPVPPSEPEKSPFNPGFPQIPTSTSESKEFTMLHPVPPAESKSEYSPFNQGNTSRTSNPASNTTESKELPPLTSAPIAGSTTLPPLTPVPPSESRNNFNFGSRGLFQVTCNTVDGEVGSCVSVFECEPYLALLQQSRSNPALVQILRKAHCGFEGNNPKVCCPRPGIPTAPPPPPTTSTTTAAPATEPPGKSKSGDYISVFPEPPVCGFSNASLGRIVNGIPANLGDFPWMALLGYKNRRTQETRWLCGGSLISSKHILTAAHCIHGHEVDLHVVRLGELDLAREDDGATPIDVLVKTKIKHQEYSPSAFTNDIGILVLDRDVKFTELIKPICIPRDSELRARSFENYTPIIAGWGDTEFRGPSATHLQVLQLPVVSNEYCAQAYAAYKAQTIDQRVLCAGFKKGGKDACQGDSGGPLMQPIWNTQDYSTFFYQIGVVSYGKKCAEAGFPGVYTRVTQFVPWLEEQLLGSA